MTTSLFVQLLAVLGIIGLAFGIFVGVLRLYVELRGVWARAKLAKIGKKTEAASPTPPTPLELAQQRIAELEEDLAKAVREVESERSNVRALGHNLKLAHERSKEIERYFQWLLQNAEFLNEKRNLLPPEVRMAYDWHDPKPENLRHMEKIMPIFREHRHAWYQERAATAELERRRQNMEVLVREEAIRDLARIVYTLRHTNGLPDKIKAVSDKVMLAVLGHLAALSKVDALAALGAAPWAMLFTEGRGTTCAFTIEELHAALKDLVAHRRDEFMQVVDTMPRAAGTALMRLSIELPRQTEPTASV